jgi:maltose alpha-D-glucosyltransferase/alpha-amylase
MSGMIERKSEDVLWYKDAIIYEIHIRAYYDSNNDGIGDLNGVIEKLDYLQKLGVTALWLLPFYPSPLKDDGYDISDYLNIHNEYGNLRDLKELIKQAHKRNLRVIVELVLNHTSSSHSWFQKARKAPAGSSLRQMYVWSENPNQYKDARIIFKDYETSNWSWDPEAQAYFWHRFYSHQPDLNFENEIVHKVILRIINYWLNMGIDGIRLDAVPYLYEKEGTHCENLDETHAFLKKLRASIDNKFRGKMLLAEANQWPEDAAQYFGNGDECHMAFNFPLMPRMYMSLQMEDNFPIMDILKTTPLIPENCQWAIFLRNHDELTLEMVTDEERDFMYNVYAKESRAKINLGIRRRLAPLLSNNRRKIELMNILLFSLPGTPIIYYGDEIGMGDNYYLGDRNGVRTPMQWNSDKNAGFSKAHPHKIFLPIIIDPEYHYETINVQNQNGSVSSLLSWMRNVITVRKRFKAFSRGDFQIIDVDNSKIFAFSRESKDEKIIVVVNLSRFSQFVYMSIEQFAGYEPREVFGHSVFPVITEKPYALNLGPYDYYWLTLLKRENETDEVKADIPVLECNPDMYQLFSEPIVNELEMKILPIYFRRARWFRSKSKIITAMKIVEKIQLDDKDMEHWILIVRIGYFHGNEEMYLLPVAINKYCLEYENIHLSNFIIAYLEKDKNKAILYDAINNQVFHRLILKFIIRKKKNEFFQGETFAMLFKNSRIILTDENIESSNILKADQSNSAIIYDKLYFLKLYRKVEAGVNPEKEILKFLTYDSQFDYMPPLLGTLEMNRSPDKSITIAILEGFVDNSGSAYSYFYDTVTRFFESMLGKNIEDLNNRQLLKVAAIESSTENNVDNFIIEEFFEEMVRLLGKRTAELHIALSSQVENQDFESESFSVFYQRSLYQSIQGYLNKTYQMLNKNKKKYSDDVKTKIDEILNNDKKINNELKILLSRKINTKKIRVHGDYHLGQLLFTGKDFVIIDFEGEPSRSLSERRLKRPAFKDVAGMLRSFDYVANAALLDNQIFGEKEQLYLKKFIAPWVEYISKLFLNSYIENAMHKEFIPVSKEEQKILLNVLLIEKVISEINYEINNRPTWIPIPLNGLISLLHNKMVSL